MKFLIFTVAILAVLAFSFGRGDFDTIVLNYLEANKALMPCGDPELGIPILAPFQVDEYFAQHSHNHFNVNLTLYDLYVSGLNDVELIHFDYNNKTRDFAYKLYFPSIAYSSDYYVSIQFPNSTIKTSTGVINMTFNEMDYIGHFRIAPNEQGYLILSKNVGKLKFRDIIVNNWISDHNHKLNELANTKTSDFFRRLKNELHSGNGDYSLWHILLGPYLNGQMTESEYCEATIETTKRLWARAEECATNASLVM